MSSNLLSFDKYVFYLLFNVTQLTMEKFLWKKDIFQRISNKLLLRRNEKRVRPYFSNTTTNDKITVYVWSMLLSTISLSTVFFYFTFFPFIIVMFLNALMLWDTKEIRGLLIKIANGVGTNSVQPDQVNGQTKINTIIIAKSNRWNTQFIW